MADRIVTAERSGIADAAQSKHELVIPQAITVVTSKGLLLRVHPSDARTFYGKLGCGWRVRTGPSRPA